MLEITLTCNRCGNQETLNEVASRSFLKEFAASASQEIAIKDNTASDWIVKKLSNRKTVHFCSPHCMRDWFYRREYQAHEGEEPYENYDESLDSVRVADVKGGVISSPLGRGETHFKKPAEGDKL